MDIHRVAAEVVVLHDGRFTRPGRIPMLRKSLELFAAKELNAVRSAACTAKNLIQSIVHDHLVPPRPHVNLTGISGRQWITRQTLPEDERAAVERHLAQID